MLGSLRLKLRSQIWYHWYHICISKSGTIQLAIPNPRGLNLKNPRLESRLWAPSSKYPGVMAALLTLYTGLAGELHPMLNESFGSPAAIAQNPV
jgi:hypothetical protein